MLKILQARLQQYVNWEISDVQAGFIYLFFFFKLDLEKVDEPEIKLPTSAGSSRKQEFQKNICFCFTDYSKAFGCLGHNKLENS